MKTYTEWATAVASMFLVLLMAALAVLAGLAINLAPLVLFYGFIAWVLQWLLLTLFGLSVKFIPLMVFIWFVDVLMKWWRNDRSTKG